MLANTKLPFLARLHAALDSLETTDQLIGELRQGESFWAQRTELRSVADLVAEARLLVRGLLGEEADRMTPAEGGTAVVLAGGAAGDAYEVGVLLHVREHAAWPRTGRA